MQTPLTKQTTISHIEQKPETGIMPEYTNKTQVTEMQIPRSFNETTSPTARCENARC